METMKLRAVIAEGFFVLFSCIVQILHSQIVCEGASELSDVLLRGYKDASESPMGTLQTRKI
jgi:hypothetical protein